ncbi:MAG: 4Fe-4S binding protein [Armatimonadetes bacterium]|nr:4Fe-4S binding protein [Armatimonadota bacterium]
MVDCVHYCQFAAISVDDGLARIDAAACMGCGVCVARCPQEAIELVREPAKGEPLEIQKLIATLPSSHWTEKAGHLRGSSRGS